MSDSSEEHVPISVDILLEIQKKINSQNLKIVSALEDHFLKIYNCIDEDLHLLMELKISLNLIGEFLRELLLDATEQGVEIVHLLPMEVEMMATIVRSVDAAFHGPFLFGTNLLEH